MARYVSSGDTQEDIRHYQKRLIPLNIFVCILCLVSIITMMFVPFLRLDIGKIISSEDVRKYVKDTVSDSLGKASNGNGNQNSASVGGEWVLASDPNGNPSDNPNGGEVQLSDELIGEITSAVIDPILEKMGKSDISLNFTAFSSMKVLLGGGEAFKKEISSIITDFASGLVDAVMGLFENSTIVNMVVDDALPALIDAGIESIKNNSEIPQEVRDEVASWTPEQIQALKDGVADLKDTKTPTEFENKLVEVAPDLMLALTGEQMSESDKISFREEMHKQIQESVDKAAASGAGTYDYNLEAFLCINISQSVDIENLDKMITDMINGNESSGDINIGEGDGNNKIYTSFGAMVQDMQGVKTTLNTTVNDAVGKALEQANNSLEMISQVYGMLFIFFAVFMALWLILFLFAFFHIFAKNKRFVMWYVKMLCWIPGIIWLALTLAGMPSVATMIVDIIGSSEIPVGVITAAIGGISSWGTGVSYICYWLLWIVSIFWAFPIKHKIRKLKKQAKREEY